MTVLIILSVALTLLSRLIYLVPLCRGTSDLLYFRISPVSHTLLLILPLPFPLLTQKISITGGNWHSVSFLFLLFLLFPPLNSIEHTLLNHVRTERSGTAGPSQEAGLRGR